MNFDILLGSGGLVVGMAIAIKWFARREVSAIKNHNEEKDKITQFWQGRLLNLEQKYEKLEEKYDKQSQTIQLILQNQLGIERSDHQHTIQQLVDKVEHIHDVIMSTKSE